MPSTIFNDFHTPDDQPFGRFPATDLRNFFYQIAQQNLFAHLPLTEEDLVLSPSLLQDAQRLIEFHKINPYTNDLVKFSQPYAQKWFKLKMLAENSCIPFLYPDQPFSQPIDPLTPSAPIPLALMSHDVIQVGFAPAITAWLSLDSPDSLPFRWHLQEDTQTHSIPVDISYGLVGNYPNVVCHYAAFVAGYGYCAEFQSLIGQRLLTQCQQFTQSILTRCFPQEAIDFIEQESLRRSYLTQLGLG